jgi:glycosyltransferase involved in cell wall biosynthesis
MGTLRVVHVITQLELGGAQQNTLFTLSQLDPFLFEPHLICGPGGILDSEATAGNFKLHFCESLVRDIHPAKDWKAYAEIKRLLRDLKPDIVHTHSSKAGVLGRLAATAAGTPVVVHTYHGFGFHNYQNPILFRSYLAAERIAARKTHHAIFVSRANWSRAQQLGLLKDCSSSLIRSGVEIEPLVHPIKHQKLRDELGIPVEAQIVGMVGCLKRQKDPLTFVEAADLISQELPETHFVLVGDGVLKQNVLRRVQTMKHGERFHLLGWRRDVADLLTNFDVLVLTSRWEGLPRVIPEATIAGVPVVASDIEENREAVVDGKNGLLAECTNSRDFSRKVIEVLKSGLQVSPSLSNEYAREYDIALMVQKQQELYLSLAANKPVLSLASVSLMNS